MDAGPFVGPGPTEPYFRNGPTSFNEGSVDNDNTSMVEGEVEVQQYGGHTFRIERRGDTDDAKVMRIILID